MPQDPFVRHVGRFFSVCIVSILVSPRACAVRQKLFKVVKNAVFGGLNKVRDNARQSQIDVTIQWSN
ncbi:MULTISPECIES: hypothetical protein [unclassified Thalassospira]|uniref:hypothetical protein n=1 Tax=unclassified Thalassospira TaxID=2648997 RepID=UPI001B2F0B4A|nr:hypothetical protein [Thalassospira sp.]MBO6770633.1 hypothetical protein [Thalassospira sp.]|tara:strand:- start:300 stop:500 length:201 start_codon:yes stop_codon:yes gene_type:complete